MARPLFALLVLVLAVMQAQLCLAAVRFCVPKADGDAAQCAAWFAKAAPVLNATCVFRASDNACLEAIKAGDADIARGGGDMLYNAHASYDLQAFLAEEYGVSAGTAYFGVAIVKREFCEQRNDDVRLSDLKGLRMCTTGYRRTAGWTLPVGFMVASGILPVASSERGVQQDAQSVASFYSSVCAPGTTNGPGNSAGPRTDGASTTGLPYDRLCTGCSAGGQSCAADSAYSDYEGAVRCLVEGAGDVAFAKQDTPASYETNSKGKSWATTQSELRLVCADGSGCKPVSNFDAGCSYAHAPAHAFVGRPNFVHGPLFARSLATYTVDSPTAEAWMEEGKDLGLLSASTTKLVATRSGGQPVSIVDYITPTSFSYFRAVRSLQESAPAATSGGGGDGLSDGAIAGIVVGSVVGTALLVGLGMWLWGRRQRRNDWERYQAQHLSAKVNGDPAYPISSRV